ncbi:uncharacterized protein PHACADRAFT_251524 [Phanerochaete carnosa HHB-10118-sp]|uniref:HMG box domain-containing protein n=1 Tax=Phanerochaete carnosa (strain HHB-10118-sp) TaxID=650164 RepID=K5X4F8_PHACS|nr:uncharacterized protein PHACADRAFT_251524 [Phanerochaete carnosa HHB-10118-sp]EKM57717.1 hypothetical protein PHACADRAFT_251524 [Phanerochaete carnosa HHB-10118-sp]
MPVSRSLQRRRRSSLGVAASLSSIKPGNYGITTSPRNVTFAPNVTPGTFVEETEGAEDYATEVPSPSDALFPPADALNAAAPTRRRQPPGKRRSQGYIPRPPNAFMLFRANFVRQKHVPGSIETNHGSLSKIIGNCWKALPEAEKKVWEARAKKAKAEHKEMYPNYRFRPVHNKNKSKQKKGKVTLDEPEERRCEEVAQLLLEGKKGDELLAAVRRLDLDRQQPSSASASPMPAPYPQLAMPAPMYPMFQQHRRSSSAPPGAFHMPIAVPTLQDYFPSHPSSRADTPVRNIAGYRDIRRPSSAGPSYYMDWASGMAMSGAPVTFENLQPDNDPLPDVNTAFFNPGFSVSGFGGAQDSAIFGDPGANTSLALSIGPLDGGSVDPLSDTLSPSSTTTSSTYPFSAITPVNGMPWMPHQEELTPSASPSGFSVSPPPAHNFDAHQDMGMGMYAAVQAEQLSWASQDVAVAGHDGLAYAQAAEYGDPRVAMNEYAVYGVEQHYAGGGAPPCGLEADGFQYQDEMQYHHHPVEISQY